MANVTGVAAEPSPVSSPSAPPPAQANGVAPVAVTSREPEVAVSTAADRLRRLIAAMAPDGRRLEDLFILQVLGPVTAEGWAAPTDRGVILALACWLAFHRDRPRSASDIVDALYPVDDKPLSGKADTVRTNATRLRQAIGADRFPSGSGNRGYQLITGVTTDLELFGDLVAWADAHPDRAVEYLEAALELVRGRPFEGALSDPAYQWALAEGWEARAIEKVSQAAHRLAILHAEHGDNPRALAAIRKGLEISPDSVLLRGDRLRLATDPTDRRVAWREAVGALGPSEAEESLGSLFRRYDDTDS